MFAGPTTLCVLLLHAMPLRWPQALAYAVVKELAALQVDLCVMALGAMLLLPCLVPLPQLKPGLVLTSIN